MIRKLDQGLFGYRNGHRRLAGSVELPTTAERHLLILTDLASPGNQRFTSYLSGFPLLEATSYALCRTWPAPEMPRPGSVWTHVLLIPFSLLAHIPDPWVLVELFRRPENKDRQLDSYEKPLDLPPMDHAKPFAAKATTLAATLRALYTEPQRSAIVGLRSAGMDDLALTIWRQQWPRLRREFAFCTWTTTSRRIGGKVFDLHMSPSSSTKAVQRELQTDDPVLVSDGQGSPDDDWVHMAVQDALHSRPSELRRFLWDYGADVRHPRASFRHLTQLMNAVKPPDQHVTPMAQIFRQLCTAFPTADDAKNLKRDLLGFPSSFPLNPEEGDSAVLRALVAAGPECFDAGMLDLGFRAGRLWRTNQLGALELVRELVQQRGPVPSELAAGLAKDAGPPQLRLLNKDFRLQAVLVTERPQLLSNEEAWPSHEDDQVDLVSEVLARSNANHRLLKWITQGSWALAGDPLCSALSKQWGYESVISTVLAVGTQRGLSSAADSWIEVLRRHSSEVNSWISDQRKLSPEMAWWMASLLDPLNPEVLDLGCETWRVLAEQSSLSQDRRIDSLRTALFALSVGIQCSGTAAEQLTSWAFPTVYAAASAGRIPDGWWRWVHELLPTPKPWQSGDRCKQLRHGIAHWIVRDNWSSQSTVAALPDPELLERVVGRLLRESDGQRVVRRLSRDLQYGHAGSKEQRDVLRGKGF